MKLGHKLMAAPILAAAVLVVTLGASVWMMEASRSQSDHAHQQVAQLHASLNLVERQIAEEHVLLYRTMTVIGSLPEEKVQDQRKKLAATVAQTGDVFKQVLIGMQGAPQATKLSNALKDTLQRYGKAADNALDMALIDPNTGVAAMQTADADFTQAKEQIKLLGVQMQAMAQASSVDVAASTRRSEWFLAGFGLLGIAVAGTVTWVTQRRVVGTISEAVRAAQEVAQGRFDRRMQTGSDDEVGDLVRALDSMVGQLSHSLLTVRDAARSISVTSVQIASGNQDLSNRTEMAASSLQETASSMDQLTGTVSGTADSARSAQELVGMAAQTATRGGSLMDQVVTNMAQIDLASRKINDIIGTIDGIAFQTNILALNAAVEAARAGEQGRGFAVVAAEVRSLAQRSAGAAREIKSLIGASSERVEAGSKLVQEAGQNMQDIVTGVERVHQIIAEISVAAQQESDGIGQVNQAVSHLDEMTQQNAALVEQSSAASENLKIQAENLSAVVDRFQLSEQHG
jgi:methyl-accepting chemotaxis protein